jgi:hypothetical protein
MFWFGNDIHLINNKNTPKQMPMMTKEGEQQKD